MRFAPLDRHFTGISVPVAALRTAADCGVGEFADLVPLGEWCRDAGLDLIQLLPVNDTGTNSSPYSALSAFALHPLYLNLDNVPGAARYAEEIARFRTDAAGRAGGQVLLRRDPRRSSSRSWIAHSRTTPQSSPVIRNSRNGAERTPGLFRMPCSPP